MSVNDIFEMGKQGLAANKQALQTTSNNIANANTPGYSRQRPVLESMASQMTDGKMIGGGVDVKNVIRVHDEFATRQAIEEAKNLGGLKVRADGMRHLESLFYKDGFELGELTNKFFNSYRELSANPESQATRGLVRESAINLADGFRKLNDGIVDMKRDIDVRLNATVDRANANLRELADLNEKIVRFESVGQMPNELLDRRDTVVREISQTLGFPIIPDEGGRLNFSAGGMGVLVQGSSVNELTVQRTAEEGGKSAGSLDIFVKDNFGLHKATSAFKEGEIAGMLYIRDQALTHAQARLDHAAYQINQSVNQVHEQGVGVDGLSGRALFKSVEGPANASANMYINEEVARNVETIASGFSDSGPGDNRLALAMADLQNHALMPTDGILKEEGELRFTINESLNSLIGDIATQTANEDQLARHQDAIVGQLDNYRDAISGVSLEEEAIHMIQYQAVFNAAAKTMKVGDELLQTILSLKD